MKINVSYTFNSSPTFSQNPKKSAEIIGLPFENVMTNMDKYANTSGGIIPILLDEVNKSGKLIKGNVVLFAAVSSGWTYGASILKWV